MSSGTTSRRQGCVFERAWPIEPPRRYNTGRLETIRDANEIRDRLRLELSHHIRSMQLDGALLGAEVRSDLLVQETLYHQPEHLLLARRERG